jgi:uncharacterized membrane protein
MVWRGNIEMKNRWFAILPYSLVLLAGFRFGAELQTLWPTLGAVLAPLLFPAILVYSIVPFADLVVFFALYFLIVRNERIPHFIRFNTMQALLLNIVLFVLRLTLQIFEVSPSLQFIISAIYTAIFLTVLGVVGYTIVQSLRGRYAEFPAISDAVYMQVP